MTATIYDEPTAEPPGAGREAKPSAEEVLRRTEAARYYALQAAHAGDLDRATAILRRARIAEPDWPAFVLARLETLTLAPTTKPSSEQQASSKPARRRSC